METRPEKKGFLRWAFRKAAYTTAVIALHTAIYAAVDPFMTSGEDYLRQRGLNPEIARKLSDGRQIRMREGFSGLLHTVFYFPTRYGLIANAYYEIRSGFIRTEKNPYTQPSPLLIKMPDTCYVSLGILADMTSREIIASLAHISESEIERTSVTAEELRRYVVLHEFRHCSLKKVSVENDPDLQVISSETDSDLASIKALGNKKIQKTVLYARALGGFGTTHDIALSLDTQISGKDPLRPITVSVVGLDALAAMKPGSASLKERYTSAKEALENPAVHRDSLLKRRIELVAEAAEYFAPSLAGQGLSNGPKLPTLAKIS